MQYAAAFLLELLKQFLTTAITFDCLLVLAGITAVGWAFNWVRGKRTQRVRRTL